MSTDAWFANFERMEAEHPELDDETLSDMATKKLKDDYADRADQINDERWIEQRAREVPDAEEGKA